MYLIIFDPHTTNPVSVTFYRTHHSIDPKTNLNYLLNNTKTIISTTIYPCHFHKTTRFTLLDCRSINNKLIIVMRRCTTINIRREVILGTSINAFRVRERVCVCVCVGMRLVEREPCQIAMMFLRLPFID